MNMGGVSTLNICLVQTIRKKEKINTNTTMDGNSGPRVTGIFNTEYDLVYFQGVDVEAVQNFVSFPSLSKAKIPQEVHQGTASHQSTAAKSRQT